ncbi:DJ-1/PfpI family protein [Lutimaribacter marinistellae]|uniref:DJ-1/PfpI family protein n=1 Tax=Lutimaribacter marinistellae TaxID=1820329 RepID=A0ABV7TCH8_9RHOB
MTRIHIGALFFPGFEMLDIYGPLELFSMHREAYGITPVGLDAGPVPASGGPATLAEAGIAATTIYDMVIVPGGAGAREARKNDALLDWLVAQAAGGALMASVCTGSVLLGRAGLLDGRRATTNKLAFDWVAQQCPQVHWQRRARWVWDGNMVTSSGVSAGMDMALAIIERQQGAQAAKDAALWAEYLPNADPDNDPFERSET